MKRLLIIVMILGCFSLSAQSDALQFPQDFFGIYKGNLKITNSKGTQTIPMEFHLRATDSVGKYVYTLVYGKSEARQERLYNLIAKNAEKGDYVVDENNGIVLNVKCVGNTLYSLFEVQGNILTTRESFYKDHMDFEITFASKSNAVTSGTTGEDTVEAIAYPITVVQRAKLIKQE